MFGKAIIAAAFAVVALAQELKVNSPASLIQCQPALLTWTGGQGPYFLAAIPGGQPTAAALKDFGQQTGNQLTWNVDLPAGTSVTIRITDSTGGTNYNSAVTIQEGSDSCMNGASSSAAAGGAGGAVASGASSAPSASGSSAAASASSAAGSMTSSASSAASTASSASRAASSGPASAASAAASGASSARSGAQSAVQSATGAAASAAGSAAPSSGASLSATVNTGIIAVVLGAVGIAAF